jgi:hypothetical protein
MTTAQTAAAAGLLNIKQACILLQIVPTDMQQHTRSMTGMTTALISYKQQQQQQAQCIELQAAD